MIAQFRLLGSVEIATRGSVLALPGTKPSVALATLLLHANEFVSTSRLYETIWGEHIPHNPRSTLQTYIMRLRNVLQRNDMVNCPIRTLPGGYSIEASAETLDLLRFRQLVERSRRNGDLDGESRGLKEALALWRGPALANIASETLQQQEVPKLTEQRLEAAERRMDVELLLGRHRGSIAELRWLTAAYPQRERFWEQLMEALYQSGRQSEALEEYRKIKGILLEQLGIDPGPGLQRLEIAILKGEPTATAAAPDLVTVSARTVTTRLGANCQLPPEIPHLVGRGKPAAQIADELIQGDDRTTSGVTAIRGAPGVGKSALALHVAHDVAHLFPDGQWYLRLTGEDGSPRHPRELLAELLQIAGLDAAEIPAGQTGRESAFQMLMRDRRVLLVLDDAVWAEQLRPLLPGRGRAAVLVTSRTSLVELAARWSLRSYELDVLSAESSLELLAGMWDRETIYGAEAAAVRLAEICGHLPLALRIAAAKLVSRPHQRLSEYVSWLEADPLARLSIGKRPSISVRREFDASFARLSPDAQRMLLSIGESVADPAFTADDVTGLPGAAAVDAEEALEELADAGLLRGVDHDRFSLHTLLHAYARQQAAASRERVRDAV